MREDMCGKHRKKQASEDEDDSAAIASLLSASGSAYSVFLSALRAPDPKNKQALLQQDARLGEPVVVYTGPVRKPGEVAPGSKTNGAIAKATAAPLAGPELSSRPDDGVPTPRPKPKVVRPAAAPTNATHATATHATATQSTATQSTAPQAAPRPAAPNTNAKTTNAAKSTSAKTNDAKTDPQKK
jgi:D-alanyl-D-alanine carboxypeptidase